MSSIFLCMMGFGNVLSNVSIPLLWMGILSSGMNKAEAKKRADRGEMIMNRLSVAFVVGFVGVCLVVGLAMTGFYCALWYVLALIAFNDGGRKISKQVRTLRTVLDRRLDRRLFRRCFRESLLRKMSGNS